jgi:hypothetical protein
MGNSPAAATALSYNCLPTGARPASREEKYSISALLVNL